MYMTSTCIWVFPFHWLYPLIGVTAWYPERGQTHSLFWCPSSLGEDDRRHEAQIARVWLPEEEDECLGKRCWVQSDSSPDEPVRGVPSCQTFSRTVYMYIWPWAMTLKCGICCPFLFPISYCPCLFLCNPGQHISPSACQIRQGIFYHL